jgi:hypothetical protein
MPRKPKTTEPEATPVEAAPEAARGAKTAAIRAALKANPTKTVKEIAELLKEQGFETTANYVSDFLGRVYLTLVPGSRPAGLFESEVKFEAVEPGHTGIDMLGGKFVREALVVGAE